MVFFSFAIAAQMQMAVLATKYRATIVQSRPEKETPVMRSPLELHSGRQGAGRDQRRRILSSSSSSIRICFTICWLWLTSTRASSPPSFWRAPPMVKPCS
jgi:hypothetical protein